MTRDEFQGWWEFHCARFPDSAAWLNDKGPTLKATIKEAWAEALRDVAPEDAREVTRRMVSGEEPPIPGYEREQTASIVRKAAKRLAGERSSKTLSEAESVRWKRSPSQPEIPAGSLGRALHRARQLCVQEGMKPSDAVYQVVSEMPDAFPEDNPTDKRRWYRCHLCRDTGSVNVWSAEAYRLAKSGTLTGKEPYLVDACFCSCPRGDHGPNPRHRAPRLNDGLCILPHGNSQDSENLARFMLWTERWKPANYEPAFDEYNNR